MYTCIYLLYYIVGYIVYIVGNIEYNLYIESTYIAYNLDHITMNCR